MLPKFLFNIAVREHKFWIAYLDNIVPELVCVISQLKSLRNEVFVVMSLKFDSKLVCGLPGHFYGIKGIEGCTD